MYGAEWLFIDRADAGKALAKRLAHFTESGAVVLGVPRGGVPVAYEVARALDAPLGVAVARKLGAPHQHELGIGAIAPGGVCVLDESLVRALQVTDEDLDKAIARETAEMERRLALFQRSAPAQDIEGRLVIVVDNGVATGVTTRAAVRSVRLQKPGRLVLAVPVCAFETAKLLESEVDEFVCVHAPKDFRAVGVWYRDFRQVTDDEVIAVLRKARAAREGAATARPA